MTPPARSVRERTAAKAIIEATAAAAPSHPVEEPASVVPADTMEGAASTNSTVSTGTNHHDQRQTASADPCRAAPIMHRDTLPDAERWSGLSGFHEHGAAMVG